MKLNTDNSAKTIHHSQAIRPFLNDPRTGSNFRGQVWEQVSRIRASRELNPLLNFQPPFPPCVIYIFSPQLGRLSPPVLVSDRNSQ